METSSEEFINQTVVAKLLGVSVSEILNMLSQRGYWDATSRRANEDAVREGLAKVLDHPLTGVVSMWSPRIVDVLRDDQVNNGPSTSDSGLLPITSDVSVPMPAPHPVPLNKVDKSSGFDHSVEIFIASSIEEFSAERPQIAGILHSVDRHFEVYLAEYDPEGDSQELINRHIASADYFVAIIGRTLGEKTALEISLARNLDAAHGSPRIKFFVQKFADDKVQRSSDVEGFIAKLYEEGEYYPREFADPHELLDQVELFFRRLKK